MSTYYISNISHIGTKLFSIMNDVFKDDFAWVHTTYIMDQLLHIRNKIICRCLPWLTASIFYDGTVSISSYGNRALCEREHRQIYEQTYGEDILRNTCRASHTVHSAPTL